MSPEEKKPKTTTKKPIVKKTTEKKKPTKTIKKHPTKKMVQTKKETTKKTTEPKKENHFKPQIEKITINIGVGDAGDKLTKAQKVLQDVTGQKPIQTLSKTTNKDWNIRKRMPIGCKVTLRGQKAKEFLARALKTRENKIADYSFDKQGNLAFGIPDHTLFKEQKYDPNIGIFGMDVCITIKKPGYRIKHRRINRMHIPTKHLVKKEETMQFLTEEFNAEVIA